MIGRLIRIFFFAALAALIISRLFNRKQKHALHEVAVITAWACLAAAGAALLLRFWQTYH
ncbi:MAG: hypothetical protein Q4D82_05175 [Neisseria sp.]|nr:hypothetical protein [Neisseria sp.]